MAKKKKSPQENQTTSQPVAVEVASDDETRPEVNIVRETALKPPPAPEALEPETPGATQALPVRMDSRTKTAPSGIKTRPIPIETLELAENRDRSATQAFTDEDTKPNHVPFHDKATGPLPEIPKHDTAPLPAEPERAKSKMSPWSWALLGASSMLLMAGVIWFFFLRTSNRASAVSVSEPVTPMTPVPSESDVPEVPPVLRPYMEKAKNGDAKAMAMLAVMYDNGLNVRQDKAEARKWYEKAAEAGQASAKKWLKENPKK